MQFHCNFPKDFLLKALLEFPSFWRAHVILASHMGDIEQTTHGNHVCVLNAKLTRTQFIINILQCFVEQFAIHDNGVTVFVWL